MAAANLAALRYAGRPGAASTGASSSVAPGDLAVTSFGEPRVAPPSASTGLKTNAVERPNVDRTSNAGDPDAIDARPIRALGDDVDPVTGLTARQVAEAGGEWANAHRRGKDGALVRGDALRDPFDDERREKKGASSDAAVGPPTTKADVPLLFKHVRKGEYDAAKRLFKRGIDPNCRDKFGNTPLIVACQNGSGRIAKLCLRRGADVNATNAKKNAALHFTVQYGFTAMGDWLVENGADRDLVNDAGQTAYEGIG
jgi:hypothetical protein